MKRYSPDTRTNKCLQEGKEGQLLKGQVVAITVLLSNRFFNVARPLLFAFVLGTHQISPACYLLAIEWQPSSHRGFGGHTYRCEQRNCDFLLVFT